MSMSPTRKLFKTNKKKKWLNFDIYGPIKYRPKKTHKLGSLFSKDKDYILEIPKKELSRQWKKDWQGKQVRIVGAYNLFKAGRQVVCVHNKDLGDFAAPTTWLVELAGPKLCVCAMNTIWAKGCQCGGI